MARGARHRLEARAAQAVDGSAGDVLRETSQEKRHPGHVAVVLAGLVGAPHVDVLHLFRRDAGPLHERLEDQSSEVVGRTELKEPPCLPIGVRTAPTIQASLISR